MAYAEAIIHHAPWQLPNVENQPGDTSMSTAKVIEIVSESEVSFEDAISKGIKTAAKTVHNIRSAWVQEQQVKIDKDKIVAYRVNLKITFILD